MAVSFCDLDLFPPPQDYVRSVVASPVSGDHVLSGSYDHTAQLWDLRSQTAVLQFDHGAPVEAVLVFPSGGTCISAGELIRPKKLLAS